MNKFVRFDDDEAAKMLETMAANDRRSEGKEIVVLIRAEWERRGLMRIAMTSVEDGKQAEEVVNKL